jgi:hypothetical protein
MKQITLTRRENTSSEKFVVNLENEQTGQTESYTYFVRRLGGKSAMKVQLLSAEFARDKQRDEIVGSSLIQQIINLTTKENDETPDLLDLFDLVGNDQLKDLVQGLAEAAQGSTVGSVDNEPTGE